MFVRIPKKSPLFWLYLAGVLLLVVAGLLWCFVVNTNPERVFWKTIGQGLASSGITIHAERTTSGTKVDQYIQYSLGGANLSRSITTISQGGTTVENEMIGTPKTDYTRYLKIVTDQKKPDGGAMNFSKVLNVWTKSEEGTGQFFAQSVFGASLPIGGMGVPIGNMNPDARSKLIKHIHDTGAYKIDYSKTKKERVHLPLLTV